MLKQSLKYVKPRPEYFEETYPGQKQYELFCRKEYEKLCEQDFAKRKRHLEKADNTLHLLSNSIQHTQGVYVHINSIKDKKIISKHEIPTDQNVLFLDLHLSLLQPTPFYISLMESVGIENEQCTAALVDYYAHERENGKFSIYPVVQGGSYNPYLKYKSNRSCASRRLKKFDILSQLIKKKIFAMNINLTFPKQISNLLFNDPAGKKKVKQIEKLFYEKLLSEDIFTIEDKTIKTAQGLVLSKFTNFHDWGDLNPFSDHIHIHTLFPNFLYDPKNKKFIRLQPYLNPGQLSAIKEIFYQCQKEVLHYGENTADPYSKFDFDYEKLNIYFQYLPGYQADMERPEQVEQTLTNGAEFMAYKSDLKAWHKNNKARCRLHHSLKYLNRSYLIDLGNFLDFRENEYPDNEKDFVKKSEQFKKFVDRGAIQNRTSCTGYLRNLEQVVKDIDWDLYVDIYGFNIDRNYRRIEKYRPALRCEVTGEALSKNRETFIDFTKLRHLSVFISYKTGMIKVGDLTFGSTPFKISTDKPPPVAVIIEKLETERSLAASALQSSAKQEPAITTTPSKICSCGLKVISEDWNCHSGTCVYCSSLAHSISYPPAKEYERTKFIMKNLWELRIIKREPNDEKFDKLSNKKTFELNCGRIY